MNLKVRIDNGRSVGDENAYRSEPPLTSTILDANEVIPIMLMDDKIKSQLLRAYHKRCKIKGYIAFFQWRDIYCRHSKKDELLETYENMCMLINRDIIKDDSAAHGDPSKRGKGGRASRSSTIKSKEEARRLSANKKKGKQAAKKMTMKEIMMHNLAMADKPYYINKLEKIGWKDP